VAGGSQGAHNVNTAVIDMLPYIDAPESLEVIHQSGPGDLARVRQAYAAAGIKARTEAFFNDMYRQYARADLVICRAGATTVAELTCSGRPAIFIPLPHAADNHQEINARAVVNAGAGEMIREADLSGEALWQRIRELRDTPGRLAEMVARARALGRPEAADTIVADIVHQFLQPASPSGSPEIGR
jgi:UDP-N-acetylglucosamine--N-acetylmuramyl-(pentapeptide) pyrophosphoryl-undecaprenol N-acetylglucosamine transferase